MPLASPLSGTSCGSPFLVRLPGSAISESPSAISDGHSPPISARRQPVRNSSRTILPKSVASSASFHIAPVSASDNTRSRLTAGAALFVPTTGLCWQSPSPIAQLKIALQHHRQPRRFKHNANERRANGITDRWVRSMLFWAVHRFVTGRHSTMRCDRGHLRIRRGRQQPVDPRTHSKESRRDESRNAGICAKKHDPKIVYRTTADHSEFMGSRSSSDSCYPTIRPGRA